VVTALATIVFGEDEEVAAVKANTCDEPAAMGALHTTCESAVSVAKLATPEGFTDVNENDGAAGSVTRNALESTLPIFETVANTIASAGPTATSTGTLRASTPVK